MTSERDLGVGIVTPQRAVLCEPPNELYLESGRILGPIEVAYETYGTLSPRRDNVVLVCHALSGDAHAAGLHRPDDRKPGWWDPMIGPGRPIDTDRYFVVCSNVLGSCKGTTGPASVNPRTGRPYAMRFPIVTVRDMVRVQALLLDRLGIERLLSVIGGSMGGMQALEWAVRYPERVRSAVPISTTGASSPLSIGFNKIGRRAIMSDPNWRGGEYYGKEPPRDGLAIARMIGHLTFMSDASMRRKFGRRISGREGIYAFTAQYDVERYLHYNGYKFTEHFDPNSYLYLTKALDAFSLGEGYAGGMEEALAQIRARIRFITFTSDWLYFPHDTEVMEEILQRLGKPVEHIRVESDYGHDAFLVEYDRYTHYVTEFLAQVLDEVRTGQDT
ncbi:MAG: homoserine O-acetyltransferase [Deferrisomatales bacterium]